MRHHLKIKTDYLNLLLDLAAQRTRERGDRAYERVLGMPLRDVRLLRMIGVQPGIAMGALSDESGLEKTLASKVVGSLVKRGLVERMIGQKDARNVHLVLTDEGADLVKRAEPLGKKLEAGFLLLLGNDQLEELRNSLQKVLDAELATREQFERWLDEITGPAAD
ncbi:MAG: MarR family transcriptional regulator [uncultured bacterium]|jgi:DNA-binding MarR family transcriptional regulator|nr:MAG: MarR family transcriptional regulator [uncultured bacterium]